MKKFYLCFSAFAILILCSCAGHKNRNVMPVADTTSVSDGRYMDDQADNAAFPYSNVNKQMDLFQQQVSFYGFNNIDGWKLYIKDDSVFTFEINDTKTVFECSKPVKLQGVTGVRYYSKKVLQNTDTTLQKKRFSSVTIIEQPDFDRISHYQNDPPFKVVVTIEDNGIYTGFSGNGFYVGNPVINDIWVLDSLTGIKFSDHEFPYGRPRLEFHLADGNLYGFSGCSEFNGNFYFINKNFIQFNALEANDKDCIDISDEAFLALLSKKRFEYSFEPNGLKLTARDGSAVFFKKVD
jgi:hypothetical protein